MKTLPRIAVHHFVVSALTSFLLLIAPTRAWAGPSDGSIIGVEKIVDNGPADERFNLVLLSDGYQESELTDFAEHAEQFVEFLFGTPPFDRSCRAINVWRVDVASDESGADDPAPPADDPMTPADESDRCGGGTGTMRATYFDSTFCADGVIRRLLGSNNATAINVLNSEVPEWDQALIIVNSTAYGGSGGSVGVTSISGTWENIAVHEFGHSAFGLADEYEYWAGCGSGETDHDNHPAAEPAQPNVTIETDRNLVKWGDLISADTDVPTTMNANCSQCDFQGNPFPGSQVVGLYEGAHYYHCGSYRPTFNCMMRNFAAFCPVCTREILNTLEAYEPPNEAPDCDANGPYVAECSGASTSVTLDGSGSSDSGCVPLTFDWTGPFAGGSASGATPTVNFPGVGAYSVDLEVGDNELSSMCSASVTVQDTTDPVISAPADVVAECTGPEGASPDIGMATVTDSCDAMPDASNDAPAVFPIGDTTVTWTAVDATGNDATDTQLVSIVDTTPPELSVTLSKDTLWPPKHSLEDIEATITVSDVCDEMPTVRLVSITSDEADDATGDGATTGDIVGATFGTNDTTFQLRSERDGKGDGRTYTITYEAEDANGNVAEAIVTVTVPKSQNK